MIRKHVLVIGGFRPMYKKLVELSPRMTLMVEASKIKSEDEKLFERIIGLPCGAPLDEWVAMAQMVHSYDPIDAIGCFHETTQVRGAHIASALGLPCMAAEVFELVLYKDRMRARLREAGIDPTASCRADTTEAISQFAEMYGYPVIVKPVDGRGSMAVSRIRGPWEIEAAFEWFQQGAAQSAMIIEQFLDGEEFSVEAFSEGGEHRIVCITQKYKETTHFVEIGHCVPAVLAPTTEAAIRDTVRRALTAIGVENGATHTEIMVMADEVRIVEMHARVGGDKIPELIEFVSGVNLMHLWARQTLGEQVLPLVPEQMPPNTFAAIWFVTPSAVGTIREISGEAEARAQLGVVDLTLWHGPGAHIAGARDSFGRAASVIALGQSADEATERARSAAGLLRFVIECAGSVDS